METDFGRVCRSLAGLRLINIWRAADLHMFEFCEGNDVHRSMHCSLHVGCAWRIRRGESIYVGSHDTYHSADDRLGLEEFNWDQPGANKCDRLIQSHLEDLADDDSIVTRVNCDETGSLTLEFGWWKLEVFPDSTSAEHWRLFWPKRSLPHIVCRPTE